MCRFGRFKDAVGTFLNKTTVKCAIPAIKDDPEDIWREEALVSIAQNGRDFDDDRSEVYVIFVGTGSPLGFWALILACLLIGLLIIALIFCCGAWLEALKRGKDMKIKDNSFVIKDEYDQFTTRAISKGRVLVQE